MRSRHNATTARSPASHRREIMSRAGRRCSSAKTGVPLRRRPGSALMRNNSIYFPRVATIWESPRARFYMQCALRAAGYIISGRQENRRWHRVRIYTGRYGSKLRPCVRSCRPCNAQQGALGTPYVIPFHICVRGYMTLHERTSCYLLLSGAALLWIFFYLMQSQ